MMKTKSQTDREKRQQQTDAFLARVREHLPEGWAAAECIAMSLDGRTSPPMITVYPIGYHALMKVTAKEDRREVARKFREDMSVKAGELKFTYGLQGYIVSRDGSSLYIKLP